MLNDLRKLKGFSVAAGTVEAAEGNDEVGIVKDIYIDDARWVIRYMVVTTGGWLSGRKVLISPRSINRVAWDDEVVHVNLSQQQVRDSPNIDTDKAVSRQREIEYHDCYGYPNDWDGINLWGLGSLPIPWVGVSPDAPRVSRDDEVARMHGERADRAHESAVSRLRSGEEVIGYEIMASDGAIGSVENFVFDDESWAIHHIVVDTRRWLPGRQVLVSPQWIEGISWAEREVHVKITREAIEASPEYDPSRPFSSEFDKELYEHYARSVGKAG